ncbi:MAG: hypothetical protein ABR601_02050 [Parasphingopyxis sp.]
MTITRKFRSVGWVAAVSVAALSCYLISYRVSAERGALEDVEREIATVRDDILSLNTEFETRGRVSQIERWNNRDFVLAAPSPDQVLESEIALASLLDETVRPDRPVLLASLDGLRNPEAGGERAGRVRHASAEDATEAAPTLRPATYLVPDDESRPPRAERIAFLDEQLRDEIADRADEEKEEGTGN